MSWRGGLGCIARLCIGSLLRRVSRRVVVVWTSLGVETLRGCTSKA